MASLKDDEVAGIAAALGLPGLADVHVHFLPENMLAKVWAYFDEAEEHYGRAWPVHYKLPESDRIELLAGLGVHRFPTLSYPHKPGMATWLNGWSADFAAAHPQAVHSATFFAEDSAPTYVAQAIEAGACIFKVHVQVGEFDPSGPDLDPVWGLLAEAGLPVVVHCGSGPRPGRHTGPGPMAAVLRRHPSLTAVIAHCGMPEYAEHLALAEAYPNVYLDTTMVGTPYIEEFMPLPAAVLARYRELPHKIVLGSDFPNIPYSYATQIQSLLRWDCGDDWLRQVLWHNGAALLGLSEAGGTS